MAKKEYIERGALFHALNTSNIFYNAKISDIISNLPAADVQEVRHGKNVTTEHPVDEFICSECGIVFKDFSEYIPEEDVYREFYFKYCPNCGAKNG